MSRKPADKLRPDQTRQAIWNIIRRDKTVMAVSVTKEIHLGLDTVRDYLNGLTAAKYMARTETTRCREYTLLRDTGMEAPRVRTDGSPVTQGLAREQLWGAMGMFAQKGTAFTVRDLTAVSPLAAESDAKHYCLCLHHGGHLIVAVPSRPGTLTKYKMLAKNWTGPRPVQIQRIRRTFDPNTGAIADIGIISVEGGE